MAKVEAWAAAELMHHGVAVAEPECHPETHGAEPNDLLVLRLVAGDAVHALVLVAFPLPAIWSSVQPLNVVPNRAVCVGSQSTEQGTTTSPPDQQRCADTAVGIAAADTVVGIVDPVQERSLHEKSVARSPLRIHVDKGAIGRGFE